KSETAYRLAVENLKGKLKEKITFIKDELTDIISDIEAFIDFDEDVEEINQLKVKEKLEKLVSEIDNLIKNYEKSKLVSEGAHIIITGKPNVGKSSLLNKLLERERAIVTEIPGTTRDTIEEPLVIDGILFKVIDTAGIRKPKDKVEEIGIERAIKKIEEADLVLFMIDGSEKIDDDDQTVISVIKEKAKKAILIVNKIDKGVNIDEKFLKDIANETNCEEIIYISAKTGEGIKKLKEEIKKKTLPENVELLINERHHACFVRAKAFLNNSL
ncbi:MAG: GTPase, partial [candidate division WOR-3 bacterium]